MKIENSTFNFISDLDRQRELFADCFPENIGSTVLEKKHYIWKFRNFPASLNKPNSYEYKSCIEDEMVGYYAAIPYRYKVFDQEVSIGMVCDVMTSSRYRGKGIFTKLGRYSIDSMTKTSDLEFLMGYPRRKEVIPGHLKVGWNIVYSLPLYAKFYCLDSFLSSKKIGFMACILNPFLHIYNILRSQKKVKGYRIQVSDKLSDIAGYADLVTKWQLEVKCSLCKDIDFSNWRYSAPGSIYKFIGVYKQNKLVGFLSARKIIKEHVPSYGIVDYMILKENRDSVSLVDEVLRKEAKADNVEALLCMMSEYSASEYALKKSGYIKTPIDFKLIINSLNSQIPKEMLYDPKKWHLMWVDSDDL